MANTITIRKGSDGFYEGTFSDPEVRELFGTDTLPTPYGVTMPIDRVLSNIARLNVGVEVINGDC